MAFKPNYNQQRADRDRAKAQKKQEKRKRLDDETAKRKAARGAPGDPDPDKGPRTPRSRRGVQLGTDSHGEETASSTERLRAVRRFL